MVARQFTFGGHGIGKRLCSYWTEVYMMKIVGKLITCLLLMATIACAQEVVISDFPLGVGNSIDKSFFRPFDVQLKSVVDTLHKYPLAFAVITGGADGIKYHQNNDAKNPGLALGRAHALRNYLITTFHADSAQLLIQTKDVPERGAPFRSVSIRIVTELSGLQARVDTLANRPPVEKREVVERVIASPSPLEHFGLLVGAGISTTPFGGVPIAELAVTWKQRVYVVGEFGYTFWNETFNYQGTGLDTRRRLAGGQLIVYPWAKLPVGIVGGWRRVEEISQHYYQYVNLSEGLVLGARVTPLKFLSITGAYNPSKHRLAGTNGAQTENGQFLLSLTVHWTFGGAK